MIFLLILLGADINAAAQPQDEAMSSDPLAASTKNVESLLPGIGGLSLSATQKHCRTFFTFCTYKHNAAAYHPSANKTSLSEEEETSSSAFSPQSPIATYTHEIQIRNNVSSHEISTARCFPDYSARLSVYMSNIVVWSTTPHTLGEVTLMRTDNTPIRTMSLRTQLQTSEDGNLKGVVLINQEGRFATVYVQPESLTTKSYSPCVDITGYAQSSLSPFEAKCQHSVTTKIPLTEKSVLNLSIYDDLNKVSFGLNENEEDTTTIEMGEPHTYPTLLPSDQTTIILSKGENQRLSKLAAVSAYEDTYSITTTLSTHDNNECITVHAPKSVTWWGCFTQLLATCTYEVQAPTPIKSTILLIAQRNEKHHGSYTIVCKEPSQDPYPIYDAVTPTKTLQPLVDASAHFFFVKTRRGTSQSHTFSDCSIQISSWEWIRILSKTTGLFIYTPNLNEIAITYNKSTHSFDSQKSSCPQNKLGVFDEIR